MGTIEKDFESKISKFKTTPYKHQLDCLNRYGPRRAYFGFGKSP